MELVHVLDAAPGALPRLELFGGLSPGSLTYGAALDDVLLDPLGHPVPSEGERDLGRWIGLGGCAISVDEDGNPLANSQATTGELLPLISGGGLSLLLTEERLVGSFLVGKLGGAVSLQRDEALAFSYPLRFIRCGQPTDT